MFWSDPRSWSVLKELKMMLESARQIGNQNKLCITRGWLFRRLNKCKERVLCENGIKEKTKISLGFAPICRKYFANQQQRKSGKIRLSLFQCNYIRDATAINMFCTSMLICLHLLWSIPIRAGKWDFWKSISKADAKGALSLLLFCGTFR